MLANVFIDTNIWIYLFLTSPERGDLAKREAAKRLLHDHARIIISNQVLNEMANVLLKKYHLPQRRVEQYVQELLKITDVVLLNHTHTLEAIRLTETSRLSGSGANPLIILCFTIRKFLIVMMFDIQTNDRIM